MPTFTSEEDEHFFAAIGRLAISWAQIELVIDCAVDIIHRCLGGQKIAATAPRTSLYRKTAYIRSWSQTIPETTFKNAVLSLMDQIEAASEIRHDMIHGIIVKHEEGSGEADMVRLIHSATKSVDKKYFTITTIQILEAAVAAGKLGHRSLFLGTELQKLVVTLAGE